MQIANAWKAERTPSLHQPPAPSPQPLRSAFTLVELLVVIAIIGILVALLLPAIQAAREAARRAKCQSNIHNVALAVLNYESAKKKLPVGFISQPSNVESWGWAVFILPYLEEQALYDRLRPSETFLQPVDATRTGKRNLADAILAAKTTPPADLAALQTPLAVFRCPSDPTPELVPCIQSDGGCGIPGPDSGKSSPTDNDLWTRSFRTANSPPGFLPPTSNYVGSRGMIDAGCPSTSASPWVANQARCDSNGVFFGNSQVAIKQITDGTGKTFMIGERDRFCMAGTWLGARNPADGAEINSSLWTLAHVFLQLNDPHTLGYDTCAEGFSSAHAGGGYFAFCDGSVRFVNEDISSSTMGNSKICFAKDPGKCLATVANQTIGVYQRLGWRDDGVVIDDNSF
jgi:prepilin-type N-terminal cleavage/methylation domain-containing protein/prepilin-type processing-associated H-X9-DG protein